MPREFKEKWPAAQRAFINRTVRGVPRAGERPGAPRLVGLSHPVVEAGVFDAPGGTALVLGNSTYEPIASLRIRLPVKHAVQRVHPVTEGPLPFTTAAVDAKQAGSGCRAIVQCEVALGPNDIVLFE